MSLSVSRCIKEERWKSKAVSFSLSSLDSLFSLIYLILLVHLNTIPEDNRQIGDRDGTTVVLPHASTCAQSRRLSKPIALVHTWKSLFYRLTIPKIWALQTSVLKRVPQTGFQKCRCFHGRYESDTSILPTPRRWPIGSHLLWLQLLLQGTNRRPCCMV